MGSSLGRGTNTPRSRRRCYFRFAIGSSASFNSNSAVAWISASSSGSRPGENSSRPLGGDGPSGQPSGAFSVLSSAPSCRTATPAVQLPGLGQVVRAEGVLHALQALVQQLLDLGEPLRVGLRDRQRLAPVDARGSPAPSRRRSHAPGRARSGTRWSSGPSCCRSSRRSGTSAAGRWTPASGCTAGRAPGCRCCRRRSPTTDCRRRPPAARPARRPGSGGCCRCPARSSAESRRPRPACRPGRSSCPGTAGSRRAAGRSWCRSARRG